MKPTLLITVLVGVLLAMGASAVYKPKAEWKDIDARIHQLRVAEFQGALFQSLAVDLIRGKARLEATIVASKEAADAVANGADENTRKALYEAVGNFEHAIREAQKP